jgi:hypothetical protein
MKLEWFCFIALLRALVAGGMGLIVGVLVGGQ